MGAQVVGPMAEHDYDFVDTGRANVSDTGFNDRAVAKWKQWLERAHAPGTAGRQHNCGNVVHNLSWTGWREWITRVIRFLRLSAYMLERAQSILSGHLFAPVHDKVRVIQRPRLHITCFGSRLDMIVVELMTD